MYSRPYFLCRSWDATIDHGGFLSGCPLVLLLDEFFFLLFYGSDHRFRHFLFVQLRPAAHRISAIRHRRSTNERPGDGSDYRHVRLQTGDVSAADFHGEV